jgi:hypothetical protein
MLSGMQSTKNLVIRNLSQTPEHLSSHVFTTFTMESPRKRAKMETDACEETAAYTLIANLVFPPWYGKQTDADVVNSALAAGAAAMQAASSSTLSESYSTILEASVEKAMEMAVENERRVIAAKDETISDLQARLKEAHQIQTTLETLREAHVRSGAEVSASMAAMKEIFDSTRLQRANAQQKGQEGEYALISMLSKAFGASKGLSLEDVSKTAGAGDIRMLYTGANPAQCLNIIWDAKAHEQKAQARVAAIARNITTEEVVKLKKNVRDNGADIGVIVGLYAGISNHSSTIIDIEEGPETIIYINRLMLAEDPVAILQTLLPIFQVFAKKKEAREGAESGATSKKLQDIVDLMNAQIIKFEARRKTLDQMRKTIAASFEALSQDLKSWEAEHRAAVQAAAV